MNYLPDYSPGLGRWASDLLVRFDTCLLAPKPEVAELRAAGVSEQRIETLYPLDLEDYKVRSGQLLKSSATLQVLLDEFTEHRPENALWSAVPHLLRPDFESPRHPEDAGPFGEEFAVERLLMVVGALHVLRRWPFHAEAAELGFNARTFTEKKMQRLAGNLTEVNASLERILRILSASPAHV